MSVMSVPRPNCFNGLSLEICRMVALELPDLDDVYCYLRVCRSTHAAVEQDNHSFWHAKFLAEYDFPDWAATKASPRINKRMRDEYHNRHISIRRPGADILDGQKKREILQVRTLKDMALQSYGKRCGVSEKSKNLELIIKFAESRYLCSPFAYLMLGMKSQPSTDLVLVQVLVAASVLILKTPGRLGTMYPFVYNLDSCTSCVFESPLTAPMFKANIVVIGAVIRHLNFWKCFLSHDPSNWLHQHFLDLPPDQKPQHWTRKLSNTDWTLGKKWRGCYAFYKNEGDLLSLREGELDELDTLITFGGQVEEAPFQSLDLSLVDEAVIETDKEWWPKVFEDHLRSRSRPAFIPRTRAQRRNFNERDDDFISKDHAFEGSGIDMNDMFVVKGWINTLPSQFDVPGWQRFTAMKYYDDVDGVIDYEALWAYEGVVLPGGKIIVGRWWRAEADESFCYSGPFLLWNVDTTST